MRCEAPVGRSECAISDGNMMTIVQAMCKVDEEGVGSYDMDIMGDDRAHRKNGMTPTR
jgi:hypothetical protein